MTKFHTKILKKLFGDDYQTSLAYRCLKTVLGGLFSTCSFVIAVLMAPLVGNTSRSHKESVRADQDVDIQDRIWRQTMVGEYDNDLNQNLD